MASSLWGGGLFALSIAILPAVFRLPTWRRQCIATIAQRFSILAGVTLAEVLLTGLYNAWAQLGMIRALWEVSYGRMLLVKLLLVIPLVAFGPLTITQAFHSCDDGQHVLLQGARDGASWWSFNAAPPVKVGRERSGSSVDLLGR